jgi:thioredoxin-like negative regulator of GroEL
MNRNIDNIQEFEQFVAERPAVLAYFSTTECNVCKVLKPKVMELVLSEFFQISLVYVETNLQPEVAAQNRIFAVPTLLVFFDGKEYIRKSRNFGLDELRKELLRPYRLMFS